MPDDARTLAAPLAADDPLARKRREIDAAWAQHLGAPVGTGTIRWQWLDLRLAEQRGRCAYCGIGVAAGAAAGERRATVDHVVALGRGGRDDLGNVVAACLPCNRAKGDLPAAVYRAHPVCRARRRAADTPPARLAADPGSPHHDRAVLERGVDIRFNGRERTDVIEYAIGENWIRVTVGKARDRFGRPLTIRLNGAVEAYFRDVAADVPAA